MSYSADKETVERLIREELIDFAQWLSDQPEMDVATPDEAVDAYLSTRVTWPRLDVVDVHLPE